ncbi:N-acetylmuramoyl-L-alanine amidase [Oceanobacillus bengalensis]|uniref:N-acetylmuramoyl-L-alanine amidase n=2 Tax=Oceanobacillus bengalensis TaxID=1435466 RepID=A0A494Z3U9_9BACI|nr:N-acetylmuramoyl-L-alanine amidase [Oceanobacillus bengalensis]
MQHTKDVLLLEKPIIEKQEDEAIAEDKQLENVQEKKVQAIEQKPVVKSTEELSKEKEELVPLKDETEENKKLIENDSAGDTEAPNEKNDKETFHQNEETTIKAGVPTINASLPDDNSEARVTPITHVVIHFSSNVLAKPQDPFVPEDIFNIFRDYGVSAHYFIGRNGQIYHLVSEDRVAYHAGKGNLPDFPNYKDHLNDYSIGIELAAIGTKKEMEPMMSESAYESINPSYIGYTDAQYHSLDLLLHDILSRNTTIKRDRKHIVGHDEYAPTRKTDPGSLFDWSIIGF